MNFYATYELLEPVPGGRIKTFKAREIATGRDILVHLFVGGRTPANTALLERVANLPAGKRESVLAQGDNDGTPYVVTEAFPGSPLLEDWLDAAVEPAAPSATAASKPDDFTRAGTWRIPALNTAPRPVPETKTERGEFTRMFQAPPVPEAPAKPAATAPPAPAAEGGEFTRMFQAPAPPEAPAKPAATAPPAPAAEGGEFTRFFQSPLGPGRSAETPAPPATPSPGEFTSMFRGASQPAPSEPAHAPGEFTRFFQAPPPSAPFPAPAGLPPEPAPAVPAPPQKSAGEFTRIFGQAAPPVESPQAPPPAAAPQKEPGEFTRMFSAPVTPQPEVPRAPAPQAAAPAAPALQSPKRASYLPLLLILSMVFLVALALVLYFALKH